MTPGRALRGAAMLLLGVALLAWLAAAGGSGTRATSAARAGQATASIESNSTLLAVTSDRPKVFPKAKRGDGARLLSADVASVAAGSQAFLTPWLVARFGPSLAFAPLALGLSRRGPPPTSRT